MAVKIIKAHWKKWVASGRFLAKPLNRWADVGVFRYRKRGRVHWGLMTLGLNLPREGLTRLSGTFVTTDNRLFEKCLGRAPE